jgi:uncharacterized repeat protein (TIGR03803 family)
MRSLVLAFALLSSTSVLPAHAQTFEILHEFNGDADGALPEASLVRDAAGNLYGTTSAGGAVGEGTVFKIDADGNESIVLDFDAFVTGGFPGSALIQDADGNFYGTADIGPGGAGVVYRLSPDGTQTLLHVFQGSTGRNARVPSGSLLRDASGNLFGTTLFGGAGRCQFGCGSVYRLDPAGTLHVLYTFSGGADGSKPFGPLVQDDAGNLYGVAQSGGNLACQTIPRGGCGTVFRLDAGGSLTVLHTFDGGADGAAPQPGLLRNAAGDLYGAASRGGRADHGTLFRISATGEYEIVHRFTRAEGSTPNGGLIADAAGNLYGTAQGGGVLDLGTAYRLDPEGRVTVLHAFTGGLDGAFPVAGLILDADGILYGTALRNFLVNQRNGTVFRITP